jgi:hypothetical protein
VGARDGAARRCGATRRVALLAALAAALLVAGCGGGSPAPSPPTATRVARTPTPTPTAIPRVPALCQPLRVAKVGTVDTPAATELSGLVLSNSGVLWTLNDSGDAPRVFALDRRGRLLREVAVAGAEAVDWEDIAVRGRTLYVGDIGDNLAQRPEIAVYRFGEPGPGIAGVAAERIALHYPDGAHDAEALLVDPRSGTIAIVTKDIGGASGVYTATRGGELKKQGTLRLGIGQLVTAGDVSGDGRTIVLRTYDRAFVWTRDGGESLARALKRAPCVADAELLDEGQGESLALNRDGRAFYTVPEGPRPLLRRYGR